MGRRESKKAKPRVELVKSSYQPSKAELEEDVRIDASLEELAKCAVSPVDISYIPRPRKKR